MPKSGIIWQGQIGTSDLIEMLSHGEMPEYAETIATFISHLSTIEYAIFPPPFSHILIQFTII